MQIIGQMQKHIKKEQRSVYFSFITDNQVLIRDQSFDKSVWYFSPIKVPNLIMAVIYCGVTLVIGYSYKDFLNYILLNNYS